MKNKKTIGIIFAITLFISGFLDFIQADQEIISTSEVVGFYIVYLGTICYLYAIFTKKKIVNVLASILITGGFLYTGLMTFKTLTEFSGHIKLGEGVFLYFLAAIFFFISLFMKEQDIKKKTSKEEQKLTENVNNLDKETKYIIATYIYGIKEKKELANHQCILIHNDNTLELVISTKENVYKTNMKYSEILKIKVRKRIIVTQAQNETKEDHSIENQMLATAFVGGPLAFLITDNSLLNEINFNSKTECKELYECEIIKKENSKSIMLTLKKDPKPFFEPLKNIYEE